MQTTNVVSPVRGLRDTALATRRSRAVTWVAGLTAVYVLGSVLLPRGLPIEVLLPGVLNGALASLTALGLVLIFRTTRIINFAQANIGGLAGTMVVLLVTVAHWNYFLAAAFGLVVAALLGAYIERVLLGPIREAPRLIVTVATIGVAQVLGGATLYIAGFPLGVDGYYLPQLFHIPKQDQLVVPFHAPLHLTGHAGSIKLTGDYLVAVIAIPIVLVLLNIYFNRTDNGIGARAAADSSERALLLGLPVRRLTLLTWMVSGAMAGLAAILSSGVAGFQANVPSGPENLIAPLAAAVIAGFDSLVIAFVASIVIGLAQQAIFWSYPQASLVDLAMFCFIVVALLFRRASGSRVGGEDAGGFTALAEPRPLPPTIAALPQVKLLKRAGLGLIAFVLIVVPLALGAVQLIFFAYVAIFMIVAISLVILAGWGGQVSLCQFAFVGLGAGTSGYLLNTEHASMLVCLVGSTVVGLVAAVLIGIPALRVRGLYLAVITMAFAVPASSFFLNATRFPKFAALRINPPKLFNRYDLSQPKTFYYFCLVFLLISFGVAVNFRRSRIGRAAVAMRDNERFAAAVSLSGTRVRLTVFGISGAMAGLAGGLYAIAYRGIPFNGFSTTLNFQAFTMVVVGGMGSAWGAVLGALYVYSAEYFLGSTAALFATGSGIVTVLAFAPGGLSDLGYKARDVVLRVILRRLGLSTNLLYARPDDEAEAASRGPVLARARASLSSVPQRVGERVSAVRVALPSPVRRTAAPHGQLGERGGGGRGLLEIEALEAGYGHLQILFGVDVDVLDGEIFALLGTNGAGKSTILRVVSGLLGSRGGRVLLDGEDISRLKPAERVARGVVLVPGGRGVFGTLTVAENLRLAGWINRRRGDNEFIRETTAKIYELFPVLRERANQKAALMSGGEQQMLTIAQALLCKPRLLMIDELSLGLAPVVVGELLAVLRRLNGEGMTMILVEQSMNIAADIAPRGVFLEKGQVRFTGATAELASQKNLVRSVFLADRPASRRATATVVEPVTQPLRLALLQADPLRAPATPAVVLETRGLWKSYGGVTPVAGVDLSLYEGQILGVIGANGAGKTTLFDVICGFVKQDRGELFLNGTDITTTPPAGRFGLGLGRTFQDLRLVPTMNVAEVLAVAFERHVRVREPLAAVFGLPAALRSEAEIRSRVEELVEEFNLGRVVNSFISELSTGTRRIVELAAATAHNPSVLVLDEPSSGLAQKEAEAMVPLLLDMKRRTGATIAIIEHDIPMIKELSDEIVCLRLGSVLARGSAAEVLANPEVIASYLGIDAVAVERSGATPRPRPTPRARHPKVPIDGVSA